MNLGLIKQISPMTLDTIIMMGQSNEEGGDSASTTVGSGYANSQPNTYIYYKPDASITDNGVLQKYQFGCNSNYRASFYACPDAYIGVKYNQLTGKPLLIIKYCLGGSALVDDGVNTLAAGLWQIDANAARANNLLHYTMALNRFIIPCINFCRPRGITLNILATHWCQGETDTGSEYRSSNYQAQAIRLFDALKIALTPYNVLSPNYKPIITRIHNNFTPGTRPYLTEIRTALVNVANHYNSYWIDSDAYSVGADLTHWTAAGQQQHGIDIATILNSYFQPTPVII